MAARALSFKDASLALFLTPSAVSHQIKALEEQLGVRLFERKTRSLELTLPGQRLLDEVEPLLRGVDDALSRVSKRPSRRGLRVTMPPFFASELFVPRLASFYEVSPDVDIYLSTHDPRPAEHAQGADVSILLACQPPSDLIVHELFALNLVAACSGRLIESVHRLGADALREHALIVHKSRPEAFAQWADEAGLDPGSVNKVIELDSMYAVVRAAERGLGIAMVPIALTTAWFQNGALVPVSTVELPTTDRYFLVHRQDDAVRAEVRALMQWAHAEFGRVELPVPAPMRRHA